MNADAGSGKPSWWASQAQGGRLIAAILGFHLLLVGLLWVAVFALLHSEREDAIREANSRNDTLAFAFEQFSLRTLDSADAIVRYLVREYQRSGKDVDLAEFFAAHTFDTTVLIGILLADAKGDAVTNSLGGASLSRLNISDREHFKVHVANDTGKVFVGPPVLARGTTRVVIPISRRINGAGGAFEGVAIALLQPKSFTDVLQEAKLRPLDIISLVGTDGITRARLRGSTPSWGEDIGSSGLFKHQRRFPTGNYFAKGGVDGVPRFFSYRKLPDYDLFAVAGAAEADVLAEFRIRRTQYIAATAIASALIAAFAWFLLRTLARQRDSAAKVERSEARYRMLVETADEGIWQIDAQSRTVFVNPRMAQMLGYTPDEMEGRPLSEFTFEEAASAGGLPQRQDRRYRRKDGRALWAIVSTSPVTDDSGRPAGRLGMVTDITERKAIEDRIQKSEARLEAAQRIAHVGSWERAAHDPEGALQCSDEAMRIYGFEPGSIAPDTRALFEIIHPDDREKVGQTTQAALSGDAFQVVEYRIVRPDGAQRVVRVSGAVEFDAGNRPLKLVGTVQDITEQKQFESELWDAGKRLEALSGRLLEVQESERAALARELHDEFGQALTAVQLQLHSLNKKVPLPLLEDCAALVDQTLQQVRSMSLNLRPPQLDNFGLVAALESHLERVAAQSGIDIRFDRPAAAPRLFGARATACFRIVQEAVTNALRHSGAKHVVVTLACDPTYLEVSIRDDGGGFEVAAERAHAVSGASLGLLSMEERARMFQGTLKIRSSPGEGTEVRVRFLMAPETAAAH